ncbi:ABC transporter substrate-binding protein [Amorphus orientalis]|uniref:Branched-chain amino acid transport system substrate-binding protein n=1 Tax=Amorphus orientalis TaxID=649198 RepID=A0AAE3VQT1_9HYPH|nr:ABC transporter substrate-binding protein [Amorphus orientalis]MDQ0316471.1 branched-chain amino acid transport system substrate-binding protein [Amorphus orientalis]
MLKTITGAVVCATLAVAASAPAAAQDYKVGMLLPYSGVYAALGKDIDEGFVLALEEAGMADQVEIIREDTEVKPPVGLAKARKLVLEDQVDVLVGPVSSGVLGAVRDFVDQTKTPIIVANAGNDEATGENCTPYIVRVSFSNSQVNRPMGQWMYDQGIRKVYTMAPDYAAGRQQIGAFAEAFKAAGGEIVGQEFTPFRTTQDFGPYLSAAQATEPDAVYVFYAGSEAINFVKQYDAFGLNDTATLHGSGFINSPLYVDAQGPAAVGTVASLHYIPTLDTPENKTFVEAVQKRYERTPSEYTVQGYDAGRSFVEAIKSGATDKEAIAKALPTVEYVSPRGPVSIDPATNNIVQNMYIYETVEGDDGKLTQKLIGTVENVKDPVNGCEM